jgi:hypothetical protein
LGGKGGWINQNFYPVFLGGKKNEPSEEIYWEFG